MTLMSCHSATGIQLLKKIHLLHYPSASAIEFHNGHLYVMGDDAPGMLVMNNQYKLTRQISVFPSTNKRINKKEKADIEAAFIHQNQLVVLSSLSTKKRNK